MSTHKLVPSAVEDSQASTDRNELDLSREEIHDVLSNRRRRWALQYLKRQDERSVAVTDVVDYVTRCECGPPLDAIGHTERKRVYTALRQSHLPKMDDLGVVNYDQMRGEVTLTENAREVQMYLEYVPENDIPWHTYYLGMTTVCLGLAGVTWAGIYPFDGVTWASLAILFVALFGLSALTHTYHARQNRLVNADLPPPTEDDR